MSIQGTRRFVALAAMSLLYFLLMAGTFNSLGIVLPMMVQDVGMDWAQAGFGFTLLGVACGAASLAPAALIRRVGVSLTLVIGACMLAAGFACLAVAHSAFVYHVGTTLMGLGFCFCGTVPGIHVISALFVGRRSTALGIYFTVGGLGSVFGPLFFVGLDHLLGQWRSFWVVYTIAALVLGGFAAIVTMGRRPVAATAVPDAVSVADLALAGVATPIGWSARAALRSPKYWMVVAAYTGCLLVNTTVHSFAVQHVSEHGLSLSFAAGLMSAAALIGAGASALAGVLGERFSPKALTLLSLGALSLAAATLALPQSVATLALFTTAVGVGLGMSYVATAMLLLDFFGQRANLELYSTMCMVSTIAAVGPALGGMARDATGSFVGVFATLAGIGLILFVALLLTPRPRASEPEPGIADRAEFA